MSHACGFEISDVELIHEKEQGPSDAVPHRSMLGKLSVVTQDTDMWLKSNSIFTSPHVTDK